MIVFPEMYKFLILDCSSFNGESPTIRLRLCNLIASLMELLLLCLELIKQVV